MNAILKLARRGLSNADIERALQRLTGSVGKPAPSYSAVRRIAAIERQPSLAEAYLDELLPFLINGTLPNIYEVEAKIKRRLADR